MTIVLILVACAAIYRGVRRAPLPEAKKREDVTARLIAVLGLIAVPAVGFVIVGYGMGMAMSAGNGVPARESAVQVLIFLPAALGSFALARAHSKLTVALSLPIVAIYFIPALQRNLGI